MMTDVSSPIGGTLTEYLNLAEAAVLPRHLSETAPLVPVEPDRRLRVGVDLGTACLVLVVLDESGLPLAGEWQPAEVVRDGLVVDFTAATDLLRAMKIRVERRIGRTLTHAGTGFPPGVPAAEARAKSHVVEAAGMDCTSSVDEPTAANNVLRLRDGVIVDVGGGTTGIAVLEQGRVVHAADEPTGGTHFSLVLAGSMRLTFQEAETLKVTRSEQARLLPIVRPVMEKVGSIITRHVRGRDIGSITLVGGTSSFPGMADVIRDYTGIPTRVPSSPMLVTPVGMALHNPAG
jgi:ethanolamine utilization protein EutJ